MYRRLQLPLRKLAAAACARRTAARKRANMPIDWINNYAPRAHARPPKSTIAVLVHKM